MSILSIIFSKLGAYLAGAIALLGLWLGYKHQKAKREEAEARVEVVETTLEVEHEIERREKAVDAMDDDDVLEYWNAKLRNDKAGDSPTATPGKASDRKPDQG